MQTFPRKCYKVKIFLSLKIFVTEGLFYELKIKPASIFVFFNLNFMNILFIENKY